MKILVFYSNSFVKVPELFTDVQEVFERHNESTGEAEIILKSGSVKTILQDVHEIRIQVSK